MRLGLLDIGSTAARLELVDLERSRAPLASWSVKAKTRLAKNTTPDGVVTEKGIEQAVRAVSECAQAGAQREPDSVIVYGTSAVRDAANSEELRGRLAEAAGFPVRALSPRSEAAVTYHAARRWHAKDETPLSTVDIGGGTIDVATGDGAYPHDVATLPLGAAALTRQYLPEDPPAPEQVEQLLAAVGQTVPHSLGRFAVTDLGHTVAQSKVFRQLAVLAASSDEHLVRHPDRLVHANLRRWIPSLSEMDEKQRRKLPGVSRSRAKRIFAGAVVADAILDSIGVESVEICPWGLREGLVFRFVETYECARKGNRDDAVHAVADEMFDGGADAVFGPTETWGR
ncbi:Ppx/GppA phosphatase family protein [Parasphingorhabdus pacifica]